MIKEYIKLMRPKHYLKNFLIFFPIIFSGNVFNLYYLKISLIGFINFCLASSFIYVINDINDKEKDSKHKTKKNRPIASGKISVRNAFIFSGILAFLIVILQILLNNIINNFSYIYILLYVILNIGYSLKFKNIPLLDVALLVSGFFIRVLYGAVIVEIELSNWLILTVISLSFYLALGKRRNELIKNGNETRPVLKYYSKDFLDKNMYMFLSLTIVFYALWCNVNTNKLMIWTVPFIILMCMKYNMNIEKDTYGDPIEIIYSDKVLLFLSLVIGIVMILIIYL